MSPGQLAIARDKLAAAGQLAAVERFVEANILDLSQFAARAFDVVVCYGGALSYVRDSRATAAKELTRVLKPGGMLLVSVMSRYGGMASTVGRGDAVLATPAAGLWDALATGDLAPFPSRRTGLTHPGMHLYAANELGALFAPYADVLEVAGSNVSTFEGNARFEQVAGDPQIWANIVEVERRLARQPGLVDAGSHIILAARAKGHALH